MEPVFLPGCMCMPEAVAYVMEQEYLMYTPLYRLEQQMKRMHRRFYRADNASILRNA